MFDGRIFLLEVANSLTMPDPDKKLAELDMVLTNKQYKSMYAPTSGRYEHYNIWHYVHEAQIRCLHP